MMNSEPYSEAKNLQAAPDELELQGPGSLQAQSDSLRLADSTSTERVDELFRRALLDVTSKTGGLGRIQRNDSLEAWIENGTHLPNPDLSQALRTQGYLDEIDRELIQPGLFNAQARGVLMCLVQIRVQILELEELRRRLATPAGTFVTPEYFSAEAIAQRLVDDELANLNQDWTDPTGDQALYDRQFFRLSDIRECTHNKGFFPFSVFDIFVEDYPASYLRLMAVERLALGEEEQWWVVGDGWQVKGYHLNPSCCEIEASEVQRAVSFSLGGSPVSIEV